MEAGGKILIGAFATATLALVGHYVTGDNFITGLQNKAQTEITAQGMEGVKVTFARDPLSRSAVLEGDVADDVEQKALAAVAAIPGVSSVRWFGDEEAASADSGAGPAGETSNPATNAAVTKCQDSVDSAISGKKLSFRSGSAYISPESNKLLDEVAAALKPCSGLSVAVGGHTDGAGNAEVNRILSQERADRVRAGLIKRGIPENLVTATGYGSQQPLAGGSGANADAQNRRIEFKIMSLTTADGSQNDATAQQGK